MLFPYHVEDWLFHQDQDSPWAAFSHAATHLHDNRIHIYHDGISVATPSEQDLPQPSFCTENLQLLANFSFGFFNISLNPSIIFIWSEGGQCVSVTASWARFCTYWKKTDSIYNIIHHSWNNVCNTEAAAATSCWTPWAWLMEEGTGGGEDVISWITALLPRPMLRPATVGASVPRLVIQYTNYKYALASLIYNTRQ